MEKEDSCNSNSSGSSSKYRSRLIDDVSSCSRVEVMRVVRLLLESLEIAFFLGNIYMENYGLAKIFDIINQIIPTAYVYNTGYWVFYNNQYKQSICVCNRFGIRCPHDRNHLHFVNLNSLVENVQNYFLKPFTGKLYPVVANIKVTPVLSDILRAYDVKINVTVKQLIFQNNNFIITNNEKSSFSMKTRYILTPEHFPLENTIVQFEPSPTTHQAYTSYFQTMERFHEFPTKDSYETQIPRTHTIVSADLPRFGMVPNDVIYGPPPYQFSGRNVKLQQRNNSVFLGGFSNIWTSPEDNSCTISVRGGSVSHTTLTSVAFCEQEKIETKEREQTETKPPRHVRMENLEKHPCTNSIYSLEHAASYLSFKSDKEVPSPAVNEQNFLGTDYENAFPSLPQPCSSRKNSVMAENKEAPPASTDDNDGEESSNTDTSTEECTYVEQLACVNIDSGGDDEETRSVAATNETSDSESLRLVPEVEKDVVQRKKEIFQIKKRATSSVDVNDRYFGFPSPSVPLDPIPRPFSNTIF